MSIKYPVRVDQDNLNSLQIVDANDKTICGFYNPESNKITKEMKENSMLIMRLLNETRNEK